MTNKLLHPAYFIALCIAIATFIIFNRQYLSGVVTFIQKLDSIALVIVIVIFSSFVFIGWIIIIWFKKINHSINQVQVNSGIDTDTTSPVIYSPDVHQLEVGVFSGIKFGFGFVIGAFIASLIIVSIFGSLLVVFLQTIFLSVFSGGVF